MSKTKKSLAVLLAVLMLASFMPLFASAEAITINRNNVKIVPPSVSPAVIEYGQTLADVTLSGGECWYVDPDTGAETLVPGHFEVRSTTTKPSVSDAYSVPLKFVSDDTTQYSNITTLLATTATIKSGTWPTLKVNGLDGILVEAPTAADILTGQKLREATLTGGVVNDKDGNALTGTWSFVDTNFYPTASGKYEVQFKATGYNTLKTTVDVKVTSNGNATISETPTVQYYLAVNDYLVDATFTGGKVVDENGTEITTGNWIFPDIENQKSSEIVFDKEGIFTYKAQWSAIGYPILFADVTVTVVAAYTVDRPTLTSPVYYVETKGELPFVYGNATIPGTYTIADADATVSSNRNTTQSAKVTFTPDDKNYKPLTWSYSFKIKANNAWYTEPEEPLTILVPYGWKDTSVGYSFDTGNTHGAFSWPEHLKEQGVRKFQWYKQNFDTDISTLEVGDKVLVNGYAWYNSDSLGYESVPTNIYIQIASTTYEGDFGQFWGKLTDEYTGEIIIKYTVKIPGISGTVTIRDGDKVIATYTPDANGNVSETIRYAPGKDGTYVLTATYTPAETDKVTIANPVLASEEIVLETLKQYKLTVNVANQTFEYDVYGGHSVNHSWADFSSEPHADVFDHWVVTDGNGKEITLESLEVSEPHLRFTMPEHDLVLTAKGEIEDMTVSDGTLGGTLWSFWQKLINFIIEIYTQIMNVFVPSVEQGW